ncbi:helix-turn-helix domain-containing protein [Pararhizobium sp.]|uniref:helix-turn-helix domain-containing protein n=1 Tax=Pararhizobium sp. TaxID=1977563 RepID=UPI00271B1530|nr:transcriptional regulator [Pararhizobium sp.]MDO9415855.1 transcriptional regulator [Pararhizobium sp.]
MEIRPVENAADHRAALKEIERLWGAPIGSPEGHRLDILVALVERYEKETFPVFPADPIAVIKTHMEMTGRSQRDLARLLNSSPRASEIMGKKRTLTVEMIRKLTQEWGIPANSLLAAYEIEKPAAVSVSRKGSGLSRDGGQVKKRA